MITRNEEQYEQRFLHRKFLLSNALQVRLSAVGSTECTCLAKKECEPLLNADLFKWNDLAKGWLETRRRVLPTFRHPAIVTSSSSRHIVGVRVRMPGGFAPRL